MSALNAFIQGGFAYLLTDGAVLDRNGYVTGIGRKVALLPRWTMAIGWAGRCALREITAGFHKFNARDQASAIAALPSIARHIHGRNVSRIDDPISERIVLLAAIWRHVSHEPQLWVVHSDNIALGARYQPFTLARLTYALDTPPAQLDTVLGRRVDFTNLTDLDPRTDGMKLLEAQRRDPFELFGKPCFAVGGYANLTMISEHGVQFETLKRWPDQVGCPITPLAEIGHG